MITEHRYPNNEIDAASLTRERLETGIPWDVIKRVYNRHAVSGRLPNTMFQRLLSLTGACPYARMWVGGRGIDVCWDGRRPGSTEPETSEAEEDLQMWRNWILDILFPHWTNSYDVVTWPASRALPAIYEQCLQIDEAINRGRRQIQRLGANADFLTEPYRLAASVIESASPFDALQDIRTRLYEEWAERDNKEEQHAKENIAGEDDDLEPVTD